MVTLTPPPPPLTPRPPVTQCLLTRPLSLLLITFRIPCACGVLAMCTLYLSSHSLFHMASALSSSRSDRVSSAQSSDRHEALEAVTEYTKNPFHPPLPSSAPATTRFYAKRL
ncbi:hypothetical protein QQF64_023038 [Cirrhinus molitorella]|uniref:Uncharacterized protein n=1 Tax=Cirrhinus molitorella TaxID=172907 RepID=A0ABR3L7N8_9TELE